MPKTMLAERIGRSAKHLQTMVKSPSWDTQVLAQACKALDYNFFELLAKDVEPTITVGASVVAEPAAAYAKNVDKSGVDITIHIDPSDPDAQRKLLAALKAIGNN